MEHNNLNHIRDENLLIGKIVGVKGIKGQLKIRLFTSPVFDFTKYPLFFKDDCPMKISDFHQHKNLFIISLEGVSNRNKAEEFIGKEIFTHKSAMPLLDEDEYYIFDMIGLKVLDELGNNIGSVVFVDNYGSGDIVEIEFLNGDFGMVLFSKENVLEVNLQDGYVKVCREFIV